MTLSQSFFWTLSDIRVLTWRNLLRYVRLPQLLIFSTVQPVMFVLLFAYVFGGAIRTPGTNYINFLMPGILVQTSVFGAMQTGIGLAEDLSKGLIDRFNSLPMSRSAVLAGRTISDMLRNVFVVFLMSAVGYIIGYRFEGGILAALIALVLMVVFGFAFSWISAIVGLLVRDVETAQVAGFIWVFPFVFASSIFVPIATMPTWLQSFAKVSPITLTVDAVRGLSFNHASSSDVLHSLVWTLGILVVFAPLAVWRYRQATH